MPKVLLAICLLLSYSIQAQDSSRLFIPAGRTIEESVPKNKIYHYPNFTKGEIRFRDGSITRSILNYNYLNGEIEFIDPKGDTLAIAVEQMLNIKQINIDSNTWYVDKNGYLLEIMSSANGKLLKHPQYKLLKREKIGAYEQASSTSAIESYSSITTDRQFQNDLVVKQNVTFVKANDYYFGDQYLTFLRASKKNVTKIFPKKKEIVEEYLKTTAVDFNNEEQLRKLFNALQ